MKKTLYTLCILIVALMLGGCSREETRYHIGVSQCSDDDWRTKMNLEMTREAMFHDGVELEIRSSHDNNRTQINDIQYFIDRKVDLLVVAPNEADALTEVVAKAYRKGIPVIVVDRRINSQEFTAFIGADNVGIGEAVGRYIREWIKDRHHLLEVTGLGGSSPAVKRHRGLMNELYHGNVPASNVTLTAEVDGEWLQSIAMQEVDSVLRVHPEIDVVFAHNDRMALGAYLAAKALGREKDIYFFGVDALPGTDNGVDLVNKDILKGTFVYPTGGDKVIQLALNILEGKPYERETHLPTALVYPGNAQLMQLQNDHITAQDGNLERLHLSVNDYLNRYNTQRLLLYAVMAVMILLCALLAVILKAYWTKDRLNRQLAEQRDKLAEQRDELARLSMELEEATHAKLVFFTNVSHDFRTPLTLVADPVAQLMDDRSLGQKQHALLAIVHRNVRILLRLVNQIMDFRKYENGKLELHLTPMPLAQRFEEWCQAFLPLARQKHIRFRLETDEALRLYPKVMLDEEKLERIAFNLLSNAFKFTPENGVIGLSIALIYNKEEGECLKMEVSDTGSGIPSEHLPHIFDRFYQVGVHHAGSGIGLALVKAFVDLHQGDIRVESTEGKGTVFTVELPLRKASAEQQDDYQSTLTAAAVTEELSEGEGFDVLSPAEETEKTTEESTGKDLPTLLIIDDNPDVRSYVRTLLEEEFSVREAADGQQGLSLAIREVPDLIVCDVMMPVMDGLECCRKLKAEMRTSHIPVLMLTACSLDEQRIQGFECGADSYIAKPFNSKLLKTRLRNLLDNRQRVRRFFADHTAAGAIPEPETVSKVDQDFVYRFRRLLDERMDDSELSVEDLGEELGMSRTQLYRKLKALTNYSPVELLRTARLKRAAALLASGDRTVSEVSYQVGFTSPSYFAKCYKDEFGESPTDLLKRRDGKK